MGSSQASLMPNVAVYCKTPLGGSNCPQVDVHVVNVIGYAFDATTQPDYQYFFPMTPAKWNELVARYTQVWRYVFECATRQNLKRIFLCCVGGGAFAYYLNQNKTTHYDHLYTASL